MQVSRLEQVWRRAGDARRVWVSITLSCLAAHQTLSAGARPRSPARTLARAQSICDRVLLCHTAPKTSVCFGESCWAARRELSSGGSGALTPLMSRSGEQHEGRRLKCLVPQEPLAVWRRTAHHSCFGVGSGEVSPARSRQTHQVQGCRTLLEGGLGGEGVRWVT